VLRNAAAGRWPFPPGADVDDHRLATDALDGVLYAGQVVLGQRVPERLAFAFELLRQAATMLVSLEPAPESSRVYTSAAQLVEAVAVCTVWTDAWLARALEYYSALPEDLDSNEADRLSQRFDSLRRQGPALARELRSAATRLRRLGAGGPIPTSFDHRDSAKAHETWARLEDALVRIGSGTDRQRAYETAYCLALIGPLRELLSRNGIEAPFPAVGGDGFDPALTDWTRAVHDERLRREDATASDLAKAIILRVARDAGVQRPHRWFERARKRAHRPEIPPSVSGCPNGRVPAARVLHRADDPEAQNAASRAPRAEGGSGSLSGSEERTEASPRRTARRTDKRAHPPGAPGTRP